MDNLTSARAEAAETPLPFPITQLIEPSTAAGERQVGKRFRRAAAPRPAANGGGEDQCPRWRRGASIVAAVAQFGLIGLLVVTILGFAAALRLRHDSTKQAIGDARDRAVSLADGIVAPHVTQSLMAAEPAAIAEMDRIAQSYVVKDPVTRMKVWRMDGRVVYADDHRLIGQTFEIEADALAAARRGEPYADVTDLTAQENELERGAGKLLEVYRPIYATNGEMYLYEHYQKFSAVTEGADRIWSVFAPLLLGSLILLELMQIPLAWSLARRVRAAQRQRVALLQQALDASDDERRRIARDLHDGIVQDLIGVSYSVGAVMQDPGVAGSDHASQTLSQVRAGTQRSIRGLRTLLVDIYPASLQHGDLPGALGDLVAPYASKGIEVSVDYDVNGTVAPDTEALVYRTARETLKNVAKHARATEVTVRVANLGSEQVELSIVDNGIGFDPTTLRSKQAEGHVGLRLLSDLAASAGGTIDVTSAPGQGTTVRLRAPR